MPSAPEYRRRVESRPIRQQGAQVQTSAASFGAPVGQGLQAFGEGLSNVATAIDYRNALQSDAKAREAFNSYMTEQRNVLYAPETGYLTRTGANALNNREDMARDLENLRAQYAEGLDPRALKAFNEQVDGLQQQADQSGVVHSATQTRDYIVAESKATVNGFIEEAVVNWNNPEIFQENLGKALAEQRNLAAVQGWDAATLQQGSTALTSNAYRQQAIMIADNKNAREAQNFIDANRDKLTQADEHDLDAALAADVRKWDANELIQPFYSVTATAPADNTYVGNLYAAEAGGNPDAQNPNSSASGPFGFTQGTFMDTVSAMAAAGDQTVLEAIAGKTDAEIAALRQGANNVDFARHVLDHYRKGNQSALRYNGIEITPVNEYAAHHFGAGGGPAIIRAMRADPNMTIEDAYAQGEARAGGGDWNVAGVIAANPWIHEGMTVSQVYAGIERRIGTSTSVNFDYQGAITAALAIEDPIAQAAAISAADAALRATNNARTAGQQDAQREAWTGYMEDGTTELPLELQIRMGQGAVAAFNQSVENYTQGIDVTQPATWDTLMEMQENDPAAFMEAELTDYFPTLSRQDQVFFSNMKSSMEDASASEADAGPYSMDFASADKVATEYYDAWVDTTSESQRSAEQRQRKLEFNRELRRMMMDAYEQNKGTRADPEPTQMEIMEMAALMAMPVTLPDAGTFGGDVTGKSVFDIASLHGQDFDIAYEYDKIPDADVATVAALLANENPNETPTEDEITTAYEYQRFIDLNIPPPLSFTDVPIDFISALGQKGFTVDNDAEAATMTQMYQHFLLETRGGSRLGQ